MKNIFLAMMVLAAVACDKPSSEGTKDRARVENEAAREVENKANADKAKAMETQLSAQHNYYKALEGQFTGTFTISGNSYKVLFTFARSIPEFDGSRVRQLSEIETDINNLRLRTKAVQWLATDPLTSVTCLNQEVKLTSVTSGVLQIEMTCPASTTAYTIYFAEPTDKAPVSGEDQAIATVHAQKIATKVNEKQLAKVEAIVGQIIFANNPANARGFTAKRN